MKATSVVIVCEICGYQWDAEPNTNVFFNFCPVCESSMCHLMAEYLNPEDGKPWF